MKVAIYIRRVEHAVRYVEVGSLEEARAIYHGDNLPKDEKLRALYSLLAVTKDQDANMVRDEIEARLKELNLPPGQSTVDAHNFKTLDDVEYDYVETTTEEELLGLQEVK